MTDTSAGNILQGRKTDAYAGFHFGLIRLSTMLIGNKRNCVPVGNKKSHPPYAKFGAELVRFLVPGLQSVGRVRVGEILIVGINPAQRTVDREAAMIRLPQPSAEPVLLRDTLAVVGVRPQRYQARCAARRGEGYAIAQEF